LGVWRAYARHTPKIGNLFNFREILIINKTGQVIDLPRDAYSSFRMAGNKSTSRIERLFVSSIARRSIPIPKPPLGGIP